MQRAASATRALPLRAATLRPLPTPTLLRLGGGDAEVRWLTVTPARLAARTAMARCRSGRCCKGTCEKGAGAGGGVEGRPMAPDPRRAAAALRAPTPLPARRRPLTPATRCDPLPSLLRRGGMVRTEKIRCKCRRRPLARGSKCCQRRCTPPATLRAAAAVCCECVPRPRCMPSLPRQQIQRRQPATGLLRYLSAVAGRRG